MHFAHPLPWWLWIVAASAIAALAFLEYRRPLAPLTPLQRGVLVSLRAAALAAIVLVLMRPIVLLPPASARVAGIVVLSDGGDTGQEARAAGPLPGPPVFAVGVGSPDGVRDREVVGITAGDPRLDQSSVDLHVSAISSGFGRTPFQVRVLASGVVVETRRVVPPADGSPVHETFTVSPDPATPTVYTADIPADESEPVAE